MSVSLTNSIVSRAVAGVSWPSATRWGAALILAVGMLAASAGSAMAAPANDDFAQAALLTGSASTVDGTTFGATGQEGEPFQAYDLRPDPPCTGPTAPDVQCMRSVWYSWTAPKTGFVEIDTCTSSPVFVTIMVYTGTALNALSEVRPPQDCYVGFTATGGTTYKIAGVGYEGSENTFTLNLSQAPPPPNDDFAAATPLSGSSVDLTGQTTRQATGEPGEPNHAGSSLRTGCTSATAPDDGCQSSVWYTYSSPSDALVTIDLCDPTTFADTTLAVYTGSAVNALTAVASNDDVETPGCTGPGESDLASRLTFRATAGTTYRIAVATFGGGGGQFALHLRTAAAPPPKTQPPGATGTGTGTGASVPSPGAAFSGCPALSAVVIRGKVAADTITGTATGDRIFAGTGNDVVDALAGNDCVDLGAGTDRGQGGLGDDLLLGGLGEDSLSGSSGADRLRGDEEDDRLSGGAGNDRILGGTGLDAILGGFGDDRLHGEGDNDRISGSRGRDRINGGSGDDRISGESSGDTIRADAGNDRVAGGSGNDRIRGNPGNDRISGGGGRDSLYGDQGNDRISAAGDRARDRVNCGSGRDVVIADRRDVVSRSCERVIRRR